MALAGERENPLEIYEGVYLECFVLADETRVVT